MSHRSITSFRELIKSLKLQCTFRKCVVHKTFLLLIFEFVKSKYLYFYYKLFSEFLNCLNSKVFLFTYKRRSESLIRSHGHFCRRKCTYIKLIFDTLVLRLKIGQEPVPLVRIVYISVNIEGKFNLIKSKTTKLNGDSFKEVASSCEHTRSLCVR